MKTFLAQNQFNSDSADAAECEAVAYASPPSTATANLSDGVGAKPILAFMPSEAATDPGRAVAATLTHNKITQAVEIQSSCVGVGGHANDTTGSHGFQVRIDPGAQDHIHDLEQLIGVAGKRRRRPLALPPFAPDFPALWKAMHDKSAPRTVLDPLWADEPPLFLQKIG